MNRLTGRAGRTKEKGHTEGVGDGLLLVDTMALGPSLLPSSSMEYCMIWFMRRLAWWPIVLYRPHQEISQNPPYENISQSPISMTRNGHQQWEWNALSI